MQPPILKPKKGCRKTDSIPLVSEENVTRNVDVVEK